MSSPGQRLELRIGTSLVMTPQLQQAIKLLQLSSVELQEYVEQELEQNPLLERDDNSRDNEAASVNEPNTEAPDPTGGNDSDGSDRVAERSDESADLIDRQNSTEAFDDAFDSDYDNVWTNSDAEMPAPSLPSMDGGSLGLGAGGGSGHLSDADCLGGL